MRMISTVVGLTWLIAACGGGDAGTDNQQRTGAPEQQPGAAADSPAGGGQTGGAQATGKTHDVQMVLDGSQYKYVPDNLTIQSGDLVRYHNVSGFPHNVSFWGDSIPSGAREVLQKNMPNQMAPLEGPLLTEPKAVYEINFAGAPKGEYKYYCLPHLALGMKARLTVK
jgi:plastocyanin